MKIGLLFVLILSVSRLSAQMDSLVVDWTNHTLVSHSTPTLQVVVNPPLRRGASIHDPSFKALAALNCDYVRYVPWLPYPKLAVAELEPPAQGKTSWDFSLIDPMTIDFLEVTKGHPVILNFSTIPAWMYQTKEPVTYPTDPDAVIWNYNQGTQPRDTTCREIADYYGRLYDWYTKGGFTDELGKKHLSNYHYDIPYWEVLNEVDFEHYNTAPSYTKLYDAIVARIKKSAPGTKFVGLALADPVRPEWFEYFLNPRNHKPGTPLDMISYHFYAVGNTDQPIDRMQTSFFEQAHGFLHTVRFIESIRKRLSPQTRTTIDEVGSMLGGDITGNELPIPNGYWNLSGVLYAYLFIELTKLKIDVIGESQLVGYPTQFPSVTMMNWDNGKPNARYWVLKLIHDNFESGDTLVSTGDLHNGDLQAQGFITPKGKKVLFVNKTSKYLALNFPASYDGAKLSVVDVSTGENPPPTTTVRGAALMIRPFAVGVIAMTKDNP
jgi:hypothetical protein